MYSIQHPQTNQSHYNIQWFLLSHVTSFPHTFEGDKQNPELVYELTTENELSGIFNVCMTALRRVLKNKKVAVNQSSIEERRIKYEMASNPVMVFTQIAFEESSLEESDYTFRDWVYQAYEVFVSRTN
jgi:dGTP triphosphohydrolase